MQTRQEWEREQTGIPLCRTQDVCLGDLGPRLGAGWGTGTLQREDMKEEQAMAGTGGTVEGG